MLLICTRSARASSKGVRGASRELLECRAGVEPSERRAEAEVDALPEGDRVLIRPPLKRSGSGILPAVAIRRRDEEENAAALRYSQNDLRKLLDVERGEAVHSLVP
jgi:hypothetical protein